MRRQTRTELSKIVMIGMSKIDQVVNKLCDDCVTPQIETGIKVSRYEGGYMIEGLESGVYYPADLMRIAAQQRAMGSYNPFDAQRAAGAANAFCFSALPDMGMGRFI